MHKRRLGRAIRWSEADLDALAEVMPADIAAAAEYWRNSAPRRFKRLLEAEQVEDAETGDQ